jgi:uncharacterized protein YndB with AHSA1/START domain
MEISAGTTLSATPAGVDLVLVRGVARPIQDVWRGVTEPDRTTAWFGTWRGDARPGEAIEVQMAFEEGAPWTRVIIERCDAPHLLAVETEPEVGGWKLELQLTEIDAGTEVRFIHHLASSDGIGEIGPGWEYYLDLLAASFTGVSRRTFDDYYPALKGDYEALARSTPDAS